MGGSVRVLFAAAIWAFGIMACSGPAVTVGDGAVGSDAAVPDGPDADAGPDAGVDAGMDAAWPSELASCSSLAATCGADGADSCCNSPAVPAGSYYRSFDVAGDPSSGTMRFSATVSELRLDKYEITVGRFRAFVNAGLGTRASAPAPQAGAHAHTPGSGWNPEWSAGLVADTATLVNAVMCDPLHTWTEVPGPNEDLPMDCITWFEAMAFCIWDGGYLPTSAEWSYAAAGGEEQRAFPWSSPAGMTTLDGAHASYFDGTDCVGDARPGCDLSDLVAVGTKPAGTGRWGQAELAGNVLEWTLDSAGMYPSECVDCANLAPLPHREVRGGSFASGAASMRQTFRLGFAPGTRSNFTGARCARPPLAVDPRRRDR